MTSIAKSQINKTRHDVALTVTPDYARAARLAHAMRSLSIHSPYEMSRRRAEKCKALIDANFDICEGGFRHPSTNRVFTLPQAVACAHVLLGKREAA